MAMSELLCVSEDVQKIYSRKPNDTCYSNPLIGLENYLNEDRFSFYYGQESNSIKVENLQERATLFIFDVNGRVVLEKQVLSNTEWVSLETIKAGVYLANLKVGRDIEAKKIMVK